jgi:hypothetical protein
VPDPPTGGARPRPGRPRRLRGPAPGEAPARRRGRPAGTGKWRPDRFFKAYVRAFERLRWEQAGLPPDQRRVIRRMGISAASYYRWRARLALPYPPTPLAFATSPHFDDVVAVTDAAGTATATLLASLRARRLDRQALAAWLAFFTRMREERFRLWRGIAGHMSGLWEAQGRVVVDRWFRMEPGPRRLPRPPERWPETAGARSHRARPRRRTG